MRRITTRFRRVRMTILVKGSSAGGFGEAIRGSKNYKD